MLGLKGQSYIKKAISLPWSYKWNWNQVYLAPVDPSAAAPKNKDRQQEDRQAHNK